MPIRAHPVLRKLPVLFILLTSVHLLPHLLGAKDSLETPNLRQALHLILFEDYPYTLVSPDKLSSYQAVDLPSADFPQQFSCLYGPFPRLQRFTVPEGIEIPRKLILLDIHTLSEAAWSRNTVSHRNTFTNLSYQLEVTDWTNDSYELSLSGEYMGFKFQDIPIQGRLDRTKLVTIQRTTRQTLFAVLTPLQAIPLFSTVENSGVGNISGPQLIEGPAPLYPQELSEKGTVIIRGIITPEGRLDPDRFVLLECPHPLLGRSALRTILDDWKFQPGEKDGKPVEALTTIEIQFAPD
ncbi:MAG: energy transducer TonB [Acidobacteria bacterium]|nr:energy transducer TonB [Acidobacteriota bacterium]MCZ6767648.1 energy transducer TonB [Acidobacteriota bacterium]